jgi:hypothetical protein
MKGAIPVPGPTIIIGVLGISGNLKLDSWKSIRTCAELFPVLNPLKRFSKYSEHKPFLTFPLASFYKTRLSVR